MFISILAPYLSHNELIKLGLSNRLGKEKCLFVDNRNVLGMTSTQPHTTCVRNQASSVDQKALD